MSIKDRKIAVLERNSAQQSRRIEELTDQLDTARRNHLDAVNQRNRALDELEQLKAAIELTTPKGEKPSTIGLPKDIIEGLKQTTDAVVVEIRLYEQDPEEPGSSKFRFEWVAVMQQTTDREMTRFEELEGAVTGAVGHYLDSLEVHLRHMKES